MTDDHDAAIALRALSLAALRLCELEDELSLKEIELLKREGRVAVVSSLYRGALDDCRVLEADLAYARGELAKIERAYGKAAGLWPDSRHRLSTRRCHRHRPCMTATSSPMPRMAMTWPECLRQWRGK